MRLVSAIGLVAFAASIGAIAAIEDSRPAAAQGGIVCAYGTTQYRRCCRESYRNNPGLGPSARARDIDACMDGGSTRGREDRSDTKPTRSDRGSSSARIRRLDCSSDGCPEGCGADEQVISAFCGPTSLPSLNGDRDVQCLGQGDPERPLVLVCMRK